MFSVFRADVRALCCLLVRQADSVRFLVLQSRRLQAAVLRVHGIEHCWADESIGDMCCGCWSVVCCLLTWRRGLLANLTQSCTAGKPETAGAAGAGNN
jgi:hypothetical protein